MDGEELVSFKNRYPELIPVRLNLDSSLYSNSFELHKNVNYGCYIIVREDVIQQLIKEAPSILSYKRLGKFLGYPSCCCDFFEKKINEKFIDTWNMALNTIRSKVGSDLLVHVGILMLCYTYWLVSINAVVVRLA